MQCMYSLCCCLSNLSDRSRQSLPLAHVIFAVLLYEQPVRQEQANVHLVNIFAVLLFV